MVWRDRDDRRPHRAPVGRRTRHSRELAGRVRIVQLLARQPCPPDQAGRRPTFPELVNQLDIPSFAAGWIGGILTTTAGLWITATILERRDRGRLVSDRTPLVAVPRLPIHTPGPESVKNDPEWNRTKRT